MKIKKLIKCGKACKMSKTATTNHQPNVTKNPAARNRDIGVNIIVHKYTGILYYNELKALFHHGCGPCDSCSSTKFFSSSSISRFPEIKSTWSSGMSLVLNQIL